MLSSVVRVPVACGVVWSTPVANAMQTNAGGARCGLRNVGWIEAVGALERQWPMRCAAGNAARTCRSWRSDKLRPNKRLHLTPLRGDKIGAILCVSINSNHISIYQCGAGEAQALGGGPPASF
jgi:hypothetical protein